MQNVSFVIPTYNGVHLLQKHLQSVFKAAQKGDEIIVIDDSSSDHTVEWMTTHFGMRHTTTATSHLVYESQIDKKSKSLHLIVNLQNLRFAASCNRAVELARHSYIFLLNNDVAPESQVLRYLLPHFIDQSVFAVGCHEIETNEGDVSGGKNVLRFEKGLFFHARAQEFTTGETAWASGGSALFDRVKWLELGGFSSAYYPAYWEDTDLSLRAKNQNWKVLFEAKAIVHHNHETTNASVFGHRAIEEISWKNAHTFLLKNGSLIQKILFLCWQPYWWWKWQRFSQRSI